MFKKDKKRLNNENFQELIKNKNNKRYQNYNFNELINEEKKDIKSELGLIGYILKWFFEAKYTASLIIFMIFIYILEIFYFSNNQITYYAFKFSDLLNGNYISLFTSIFLHGSIMHLAWNMLFLLVFGRIVEKYVGWKIILYFLISGIISGLVSGYIYYTLGNSIKSLGASGAIAGIIMLAILFEPFTISFILLVPLPIFIVGWLEIYSNYLNIFNFWDHVGHITHIAGFASVLLILFFMNIKYRKKIYKGLLVNIIMLILFELVTLTFGIPNLKWL